MAAPTGPPQPATDVPGDDGLQEVAHRVALTRIDGLGAARVAALVARFGSAAAAWRTEESELAHVVGPGVARRMVAARLAGHPAIEPNLPAGSVALTLDDARYPPLLRAIDPPPAVLFVQGDPSRLLGPCVAIVGTRRMSPYGRKAAHRLASELADLGFTIVSGLAAGVDSVAHTAALDVGGSTVAVLACGLDVVYPPENGQLQAAIAASGTLVSEYPSGTPAVAGRFPARNRIIAGLSVGVVVVEAGQRSGALITAERAIDYDRKVMAVPGSIFHPGARGCHWLLESGQAPALASRQVAAYLGFSPLGTGTEAGRGGAAGSRDAWPGSLEAGSPEGLAAVARAGGPSPEQRILALLRSGPLQADEIVDALELGVSESAVALTHLEIAGLAELAPDGRWHTAV